MPSAASRVNNSSSNMGNTTRVSPVVLQSPVQSRIEGSLIDAAKGVSICMPLAASIPCKRRRSYQHEEIDWGNNAAARMLVRTEFGVSCQAEPLLCTNQKLKREQNLFDGIRHCSNMHGCLRSCLLIGIYGASVEVWRMTLVREVHNSTTRYHFSFLLGLIGPTRLGKTRAAGVQQLWLKQQGYGGGAIHLATLLC